MSALIATAAPAIDVQSLCRELPIGWTPEDTAELEREVAPYLAALRHYVSLGQEIPSHIKGTASVCVPITSITEPADLFAQAAGSVAAEPYRVEEYPDYNITVHVSTVPVVILLLKKSPVPLPKLLDLCARSGAAVGAKVGGDRGSYFQLNLPGFGWTLHTDDEYEGVASRVHVPIVTTRKNIFAWAPGFDTPREDWLLETFLEPGKVYQVRTDVPHTAMNEHPTDARLHLILDVTPSDES
jgi:hypothetical protein